MFFDWTFLDCVSLCFYVKAWNGSKQVRCRIKHFLVSKLWCHYASPQLVWSSNSTKHGIPSVCVACLCLIRVGLCELHTSEECTGYIVVFGTRCPKSSFMGQKCLMCCFVLQISRGDLTSCVDKMWLWLGLFLTGLLTAGILNKWAKVHTHQWKEKSEGPKLDITYYGWWETRLCYNY